MFINCMTEVNNYFSSVNNTKKLLLRPFTGTQPCLILREKEERERDIEGVGWDMSIPLKLSVVLDGNGILFP